jgi:hypothetical protein
MQPIKHYYLKAFCVVILYITAMQTFCYAQETPEEVRKKFIADSIKRRTDSLESDSIRKLPLMVRSVFKFDREDTTEQMGGIGNIIVIVVQNLDSLLRKSKALDQNISLFINGRKIDNIKPISGAPDKEKGTLQYRLDRNTENDKTWADILGAPPFLKDDFFYKDVKISVGLDKEYAIKTLSEGNNFTLIRIHKGRFWMCSIIVIFYLFVVIFMAKKKGLLRDRSVDVSVIGLPLLSPEKHTYSLARFQMAFWFTLTVISFFFIWLITDAYDIITTTILALIGISAGTSLSATIIDDSKKTELLNETIALQQEKMVLNKEILLLDPKLIDSEILILDSKLNADPANVELQNKKKEKEAEKEKKQIEKAKKESLVEEKTIHIDRNKVVLKPQESEGFFKDILSDVNGASFHRVQLLVWTLILGLIFLYSVWKSLSMPEFSATLLALQGITSGTYLGFKFPEKHA